MRAIPSSLVVLLAAVFVSTPILGVSSASAEGETQVVDDVPGPLRPSRPDATPPAPSDKGRATPQRAVAPPPPTPPAKRTGAPDPKAPRPITWSAPLQPITRAGDAGRTAIKPVPASRAGGDVKGRITADPGARQLKFIDFQVPDRPDLEVWLTAADPGAPAAIQMESKHVSLGRLRRPRGDQTYKIPLELDLSVYRTVLVWSRHTRSADAFARLVPSRTD